MGRAGRSISATRRVPWRERQGYLLQHCEPFGPAEPKIAKPRKEYVRSERIESGFCRSSGAAGQVSRQTPGARRGRVLVGQCFVITIFLQFLGILTTSLPINPNLEPKRAPRWHLSLAGNRIGLAGKHLLEVSRGLRNRIARSLGALAEQAAVRRLEFRQSPAWRKRRPISGSWQRRAARGARRRDSVRALGSGIANTDYGAPNAQAAYPAQLEAEQPNWSCLR